jgi:hypothetical protein
LFSKPSEGSEEVFARGSTARVSHAKKCARNVRCARASLGPPLDLRPAQEVAFPMKIAEEFGRKKSEACR